MRYARVENDVAVEIIDCDDVESCYHPDFVATLVDCDADVIVGMIFIDGAFVEPSAIKITAEELVAEQSAAIDAHIQDCIKSRDFYDIGQVALCCTDGNGYQVEALAVSAWIRKCWGIQEQINLGKLVFDSVDDAIKDLPEFDILT
ncbi:hypothetical protein UFOVP136_54 [uncultured Caudovirales phage]|uniref:Uncharacterized protein n=1 Tax=uncultured Caudovirales phage TaxID=2100421 RepID=A0A6J5LDT2_9CAUD|nr:hypothetical protein UFOVP136_54 [uncultured Caudovirales phage]